MSIEQKTAILRGGVRGEGQVIDRRPARGRVSVVISDLWEQLGAGNYL